MSDDGDRGLRAMAALLAVRSQLPEHEIAERFGEDYHKAIQTPSEIYGKDLSEFRLPDDAYYRPVASSKYGTGGKEVTYRGTERKIKRDIFLLRLESAINYLRALTPPETQKRMGF